MLRGTQIARVSPSVMLLFDSEAMFGSRKDACSYFFFKLRKYVFERGTEIDILFGKFRNIVAEQARHVFCDQYLSVTLCRGTNADRRDRNRLVIFLAAFSNTPSISIE